MTDSIVEAIRVHIVGTDSPIPVASQQEAKPARRAILRTVTLAATDAPVNILPNAPKRKNTVLTITGTAGDEVFVCGSFSDAQEAIGAVAVVPQVITLTSGSEMWLVAHSANTGPVSVGLFAEYDE